MTTVVAPEEIPAETPEPSLEEQAAADEAANAPETTPTEDPAPAADPEPETPPAVVALPQTSDANRLRAAELLASIESTVMGAPAEQWADLLIGIAAEAALLTPLLVAPVAECDACRGKIVRDAPPVVHTPECNTMVTHEVARTDAEKALRDKVDALPESVPAEFRQTILDAELPKIAAQYECNCGAAAKARAATRSSSGTPGVRGERKATKRMTLSLPKLDPKNADVPQMFTITFPEEGTTKSWTMPVVSGESITAADLAEVKRITREAESWAVEQGASPEGQKNAVSKAIRDGGFKLSDLARLVK